MTILTSWGCHLLQLRLQLRRQEASVPQHSQQHTLPWQSDGPWWRRSSTASLRKQRHTLQRMASDYSALCCQALILLVHGIYSACTASSQTTVVR